MASEKVEEEEVERAVVEGAEWPRSHCPSVVIEPGLNGMLALS